MKLRLSFAVLFSVLMTLSFQNCSSVKFNALEESALASLEESVKGSCGLSHRATFVQAPEENLCATGTLSALTGAGPWQWVCKGSGQGEDATCAANKEGAPALVLGTCGASHGQERTSAPTQNFCTEGTPTAVVGEGPWTWTCRGQNGGFDASCVAYKPIVVNGVCGASHGAVVSFAPGTNLCAKGTASAVTGVGPWTWSCQGLNGGTLAACSASKVESSARTCDPIPGVTTSNWTGSVVGYKKSNVVRQGTTCPLSTFTCDNGAVKLDGVAFALSVANPDFTNYTSDSRGCKQVPAMSCNMNYSYASGSTYVNWSFSNVREEFLDSAASGYSCVVNGQTIRGSLTDILRLNKAGPVDSAAAVRCSITIKDILGQTTTCGGYNSLWCSLTAPSAPAGYVAFYWDVGGYTSGNYVVSVNGAAQPPVALSGDSFRGGSSDLPMAKYDVTATLNSGDGTLRCDASTAPVCSGSAPLYSGSVNTGTTRTVVSDPSQPGQCMCEGGLIYESATGRCQKSCPIGTHLNDRNGVYTCDSCKDAIVSYRSSVGNTVAGTLISTSQGSVCVYPGFTEEIYEDSLNQNTCYVRLALLGWPSGAPTSAQFSSNNYPGYDGSSCAFTWPDSEKASIVNCQKRIPRPGACAGAVAVPSSGSVSGGGVNSQAF